MWIGLLESIPGDSQTKRLFDKKVTWREYQHFVDVWVWDQSKSWWKTLTQPNYRIELEDNQKNCTINRQQDWLWETKTLREPNN